jgi:hypothetical protein
MIKVNGKTVDIYDSDSNKTFLERVASIFKTHPNFIEDIDIEKLKPNDNIKIDILIDEIKKYQYDTENIENNIIFLTYLIEKYNKNTKDTIIKLFLSINSIFQKSITEEFELLELIPLSESLKSREISDLDIINFLKKDDNKSPRDEFMKEIKERISISNQESNILLSLNKEYDVLKSVDIDTVDIKKDKSDLKITTNLKKSIYSLNTIFSNMICGRNAPFLSFNNLYKVYQYLDLKISDNWSESYDKFIILKVYIDDDKYTDCNILFEGEYLVLSTELVYSNFNYMSEDHIKEIIRLRIKNCFRNFPDFSYTLEKEVNIYENAIIIDQTFDTYILSDIIMNNNIFSRFLAINESVQTTKKKSGLYVHYFIKNEEGTCNITTSEDSERVVPKNIVRLRIKNARDQNIANDFIKMIGKLLYIYNKSENKILEFYQKYIPTFTKEKIKEIEPTKISLNKQVPDLFISGYPYKCQYPPIIIDDEEAKNYSEDRVMRYPIKGEGKSYNYLCDDKSNGYIYVGLRDNTLKNRNKYKYIPCCFKSDQTKRRGPYLEYFKGEITEKGPQQNIIITNKIVRNEEYGLLPRNINKLLETFDQKYEYLRKGVNDTSLSFLDCILESILDIVDYSGLPQKSKLEILEKHFNKLQNYQYISVASQENPNYLESQLRNELLSEKNTYMNPTKWIKLCETYFKCKIILFSRNQNEKDGFISIPNHELIYLQEKFKEQKLVLIYEHYGTEIESSYPRCELIIKWDKELNIEEGSINFFSGSVAKNIYSFYTSTLKQYYYQIFNKKLDTLNLFDLTELNSLKPEYQIIDNYGKARGIFLDNILLLSDPFPPIKTKIYEGQDIYKNNETRKVIDFINKNNIKIVSQIIVDNKVKEINMIISNIIFTAKVEEEYKKIENTKDIKEDIKEDIIEKYPSTNNYCSKNIRLKRLAFIISEYFNYFYSNYLNTENKKDTLETIKSFITKKVKIINSANPYIIPNNPKISMDILKENGFVLNDKFIIENKEVLKRLIYSLRVQLYNNHNNIIDYHKRKEVYNFYKEITHFSENSINIIVKDIVDLQKIDNTIYEKVQTEKSEFFMVNPDINKNKPVLLREEKSKEKALLLSSNWQKYKKVTDYQDPKPLYNNVIYLYNSKYDIRVKKDIIFKDKPNSYCLKYRKDKINHYLGIINLL